MRVLKEGNRAVTAEIEAPCCKAVLEVSKADVVSTEQECYEFICGYCQLHFFWTCNWFSWQWSTSKF